MLSGLDGTVDNSEQVISEADIQADGTLDVIGVANSKLITAKSDSHQPLT